MAQLSPAKAGDAGGRVAIDGVPAAGKTTLGDELARVLGAQTCREVIRAQIDHFRCEVERVDSGSPHAQERD